MINMIKNLFQSKLTIDLHGHGIPQADMVLQFANGLLSLTHSRLLVYSIIAS